MRKTAVVLLVVFALAFCGCRKNRETIFDHTQPYAPPETASETAPAATEAPSAPETSAAPETETTATPSAEPPAETAESEVDLSISMPAANGEMRVSSDPANEYIRDIAESRGLDPALLAAVYTVPQPGENYVFEFTGAARTAEGLRRVYLLDENGAVKSVAAADAGERENISVTENWFCMNVLIKRVIFPAVQGQF